MAENTVATQEQQKVPATREDERAITPPVDIFEVEEGLAVVVDMPGVGKDGVEIHVENGILTIKGTAKADTKGDALYREYELADYFRQFKLSDTVDQEKIKAELKAGVLSVLLPKAEKAKPKKITVKVQQ